MPGESCVAPGGQFRVGLHDPKFEVENFRENDFLSTLGPCTDTDTTRKVDNQVNFPRGKVIADSADRIYEIPNAFPFRGTTFINSAWADRKAENPDAIALPPQAPCSLLKNILAWEEQNQTDSSQEPSRVLGIIDLLPRPLRIALAQASTDPDELSLLAQKACRLSFDETSRQPVGLNFILDARGTPRPDIKDHDLYDILGNNPHLPDAYKEVMVLRPGIQGTSEIVGEFTQGSHVFEYLRRNSYIPWGHFAANMANDQIRYRAGDLSLSDMKGLRHLYYQRIYIRLAEQLDIPLPPPRTGLTAQALESLRVKICQALETAPKGCLKFNAALWGWNFGFGFAHSGQRLHASHQMIHQQNAMVPAQICDTQGEPFPSFCAGDLVAQTAAQFKQNHGVDFFEAYISAIQNNIRTDGSPDRPSSLVVHEDDNVLVFAPKAQVSEWELQIMTKAPCSHILAADTRTRDSIDAAMLKTIQTLEALGAKMVTAVEFSGRFDQGNTGQHLIYSFIPRLPYAPDTFSEAQLRWITGCYPEDFALACRKVMRKKNLIG